MLCLVTGGQRSGKSYCVVNQLIVPCVEAYVSGKGTRPVVTNLPLDLDRFKGIGATILDFRKDGIPSFLPSDTLSESEQIRLRFGDAAIWLLSKKEVMRFWEIAPSGSLLVFDEIYAVFSARASELGARQRETLLEYSRQHGHYHDDLYLVTHNQADVDKIIRDGAGVEWRISNSRKTLMVDAKGIVGALFGGLVWPNQFFIKQVWEREFGKPLVRLSKKFVRPTADGFSYYDSHNLAEGLSKEVGSGAGESEDLGFNFFRWLGNWLAASSWIWVGLIVAGVFVGKLSHAGYKILRNFGGVMKASPSADEVESVDRKFSGRQRTERGISADPVRVQLKGWTSNALYFMDGSVWFVGDKRGSVTLEAIDVRQGTCRVARGDDTATVLLVSE